MNTKRFVGIMIFILSLAIIVCGTAENYTVPELDSLFAGVSVKLNGASNEAYRVYAYYGPGKDYYDAHGYKPYKQLGITAYYNEGGWVLIHLKYKTAKERFLYMADSAFNSLNGLSSVSEMQYYTGKTITTTPLRLGPSEDFISEENLRSIPADTDLKVFFQKNGFAFAEFWTGGKAVRMWMPISCVAISGTDVYTPTQRKIVSYMKNINDGNEQKGAIPQDSSGDAIMCQCGSYMNRTVYDCGYSMNAQGHCHDFCEVYTCPSCGNQQFYGAPGEWTWEPHVYNGGDSCEVCGYIDNGD